MALATFLVAAAVAWLQGTPTDPLFSARTELQGLYDEASQASLQFLIEKDIDEFHDVLCTSDWVFVDSAGQRHPWTEFRGDEVRQLAQPRADSIVQTIGRMMLVAGGASTTVTRTTVRTIVDADGKYGRKGASRTITETTVFRDAWVRSDVAWKLKSREQIGQTRVAAG